MIAKSHIIYLVIIHDYGNNLEFSIGRPRKQAGFGGFNGSVGK